MKFTIPFSVSILLSLLIGMLNPPQETLSVTDATQLSTPHAVNGTKGTLPASPRRHSPFITEPGASASLPQGTAALLVPSITAIKTFIQFGTDNGTAGPTPGDVIEYTVVIGNSGGASDATGVIFTDTVDPNTTLVPGSLKSAPIAIDDSYSTVGNTSISVPAGSGLISNDVNLNGTSMSATAINQVGTMGTVTANPDGSFTFNPNPGFEGTTTFTYTVSNGAFASVGTVTITVAGMIWYIDDSAPAGGDGRINTPFNSMNDFNSTSLDGTGDNIFVYAGTYNNTLSTLLLGQQKLIGQGAAGASLAALTGVTFSVHPPISPATIPAVGGTRPTINQAANNINMQSQNQVRGFNINNTGGTALLANNFTSALVREVSITNTGGVGVNFNNGVLDVIIQSITASNSTNAISVTNTTGSFQVTGTGTTDGSGGTLTGISGRGIDLRTAANITLKNMTLTSANTTSDGGFAGTCDETNVLACFAAIYMDGVSTITLDNIDIGGTEEHGIMGNSVSNLTMSNCTATNNGNLNEENALKFRNLTGTCSITNSSFENSAFRICHIINTTGNVNLTVNNCTFNNSAASAVGQDCFEMRTQGSATATVALTNSTFSRARSKGIQVFAEGNSTMNLNITGCSVQRFGGLMAGIEVGSNGAAATINYNINNNTVIESSGEVAVLASTFLTSDLNGRTNNNTGITNNNTTASIFSAIRVLHENNGQAILEIKNNPNVTSSNIDIPVDFVAVNGNNAASRMDVTLENNNITNSTSTVAGLEGVVLRAGDTPGGTDVNTLCGHILNNDLTLPAGYPRAFRVRHLDAGIMNLQGSGPDISTTWSNKGNTTTNGTINAYGPNTGITFGGVCLTPSNPAPASIMAEPVLVMSKGNNDSLIKAAVVAVEPEKQKNKVSQLKSTQPDTEESARKAAAEALLSGETVTVGSAGGFLLPAGKQITIKFQVTINDPLPAGVCQISNQGSVSGSNFSTIQTDNVAGGSVDPTVTQLSKHSLGNLVYRDNNKNGTFDGGDAGIVGVVVNLYQDNGSVPGILDASDAFVTTTNTVAGGLYLFSNLCSGDYIVQIPSAEFGMGEPLNGLISSPGGAAPDPDNNTDNDDNGQSALGSSIAGQAITLNYSTGSVENNTTLDFGFKTPTLVTINDVTMSEGSGGTTTFTFTVSRDNTDDAFALTVNTGVISLNNSDYTAISGGTANFTAGGSSTALIDVTVNADETVEANESFNVLLSGAPDGVIISDGTGLGTITNDDQAVLSINSVSNAEGDAGTQTYTFTVTSDKAVDVPFTVNAGTSNGTATTGDNDYVANSTTLNFVGTAGETQTFSVTVNGDLKVEPNETFTVPLSSVAATGRNVVISEMLGTATGTITNDDAATISITDVSLTEGNSGTTNFVFNVTLSKVVSTAVTVDFATANGTAGAGDYTPNSGTLTFPANGSGQTQTITVQVIGDAVGEANETFFVNLSNILGSPSVTAPDPQGLGTILDDDLSFSINDVSLAEGNAGTTNMTFTVTRTSTATAESIQYATANNTATTADNDYVLNSGTLNFAIGDDSETITVVINGDQKVELNESFFVNLTNASNGSIADAQGTGTITNDDAATVTLTGGIAQNEGNSGTTSYTFTATLSAAVQGGFSVAYTTSDGTATVADADYTDNDGSLTFTGTSGETKTITVLVTGDTKVEANENFTVALGAITSAPTGVTVGGTSQTGTINNDDAATVTLTGGVAQNEGNSGTTSYTFTATLNAAVQGGFSVAYTTSDGTATVADADYTDNDASLNFTGTAGETKTITVLVTGDTKVEANENFTVALGAITSAPTGVTVGGTSQMGTITNDDAATLTLSGGIAKAEGNSGTTSYTFTATLSAAIQGGFSVAYTTNDGTATVADADYTDNDGSLTFTGTAGEEKTITVLVNGDRKVEANETFTVALGTITGTTLDASITKAGSPQTGTINNDEIDFGDAPTAAQSGFVSSYPTLTANGGGSHATVSGIYLGSTVDGEDDGQPTATANGDGSDDDGVALPSNLITGTTANINVNASVAGYINAWVDFNRDGDWSDEGEKIFNAQSVTAGSNSLTVAVPAGALVGTSFARFRFTTSSEAISFSGMAVDGEVEDYQVNILNTQFTVDSPTVAEGNASTTNLTFTIARSNNANTSSVDYAITGGTATSGSDYAALASGTASFTAGGALSQTITVVVNGDLTVENNETVIMTLTNPVGGGISTATGTGTITNDDAATVTLTGGIAQNEGNSGTTSYTFTATLNAAVQGGFSVAYTTSDGTATVADADYTDNDGSLTFTGTSGETKTITVLVNGDTKVEANETFAVALGAITSAPTGVTVVGTSQTGTITNDDAATVTLTGGIAQNEGNSGTTSYTFTATLNAAVQGGFSVAYTTSDGTATVADADYTDNDASLNFTGTAGETKTITVLVTGDTKVEANENFTVALGAITSAPTGVTVGGTSQMGTITNDDAATLTLSGGIAKAEGNSGTTSYTFTATLSAAIQGGFTVAYTTNDGTATVADADYTDNDGTLTFTGTPGEQKTITVLVTGDQKVEADEAFTVALGAFSATTLDASISKVGSPQTGTVNNDEIDFGDAPDPTYLTLLANNGARHTAVLGFYLGSTIDGDNDGQPTATANGDDTDAEGDDDDGVIFPAQLLTGTNASVTVTASAVGKLDAWIDFNRDGDFADAGEQIAISLALTAGANQVTFAVPLGSPDGNSPSRFRFSSAGGLGVTGLAADGEVEDHLVAIINTLRIFVNAANVNPTQNGTTWATAFSSLQAGLSEAANSSLPDIEVWVAQGTYKPGTLRRDAFEIPSKIRVYGGFNGTENDLNQRNWKTNVTKLSGEIGTSAITDNAQHVVIFRATDAGTRLDGFTIEKGYAEFFAGNSNTEVSTPAQLSSGGGILAINKSKGSIANCIITDNKAISGGGIMVDDSSGPVISKTIIWNNEATFGGGVYVLDGSKPLFENVLLVLNKGLGGGIYVNRSQPLISNSTLASNQGTNGTAGGIFNTNAVTTVKNSILWGNSSPQSTPGSVITYSIVAGGFAGVGNSSLNPLFVNPTPSGLALIGPMGDYHLQACSPAINAGDNTGAPADDLDGAVRPFGVGPAIVDMGAYESQSAGGSGPPTLIVTEPITSGTVLKTAGKITATNQVSGGSVVYNASQSVTLLPGFSASGATFQAVIGNCPN